MHKDIEDKFNEMVEQANNSIEDLASIQSDELEPTSLRYVAMDETMTKPYKEEVHNPSHYQVADQSVQDIIKLSFTHQEYMGWLRGNIIKYRMRAFKKGDNGTKDIKKADEYQKFYNDYVAENTGSFL